jgi:hypothetical protein
VVSGSFGLIEAIQDAQRAGGGVVRIGPEWAAAGGANSTITGVTLVYPGVSIEDVRAGAPQNWNVQTGLTTLGGSGDADRGHGRLRLERREHHGWHLHRHQRPMCTASPMWTSWGRKARARPTFSAATAGTGSTNQIGFAAPAASTGAVGYVPYISLAGGSYALAYKVPLVTQPTVAGVAPVSNGVCTLTTLETITPACAVRTRLTGRRVRRQSFRR